MLSAEIGERLCEAVRGPDVGLVVSLLERCEAGVKFTYGGKSLLYLATESEQPNRHGMVKALLDAGANVDYQDDWAGWTCLMVAIKNHQQEVIDLLLDHGADPNIKDKFGSNAIVRVMDLCPHDTRLPLLRLLLSRGARPDLTYHPEVNRLNRSHAMKICNEQEIRLFFEHGLIVEHGYNTFPAIYNKDAGVLRFLVEHNLFDVYQRLPNGNTTLCEAISYNNEEHAEYLINFDFDVNERASDGESLLFKAVTRRLVGTVRLLLLHGADLELELVVEFKRQWAEYSSDWANRQKRIFKHYYNTFYELMRHLAMRVALYPSIYYPESVDKVYKCEAKVFQVFKVEFERLRCHYVTENVTFYDILTKKSIARYARNRNVVEGLKRRYVRSHFPNYGNMTAERLMREVKRQEFLGKARRALARLLRWDVDSMYVILDNIMNHLTKKDLLAVTNV
ncbi:tankyrase-2 [Copidosoma floridanum]|uniref:tankyrase-2 n=1 Tax=Copidosoma floridanum TaxID=29053 RepID=UPI0006C9E337|nr:tankyrase-2 [Copidosoma floridanum]